MPLDLLGSPFEPYTLLYTAMLFLYSGLTGFVISTTTVFVDAHCFCYLPPGKEEDISVP